MKKYLIKKGCHYSLSLWHIRPTLFNETLNFTFKLSKECSFPILDNDDLDVNKIFGRSFGFHHTNSVRLGWVPVKNSTSLVELYVYYYNNKVRHIIHLGTVHVNEEYDVALTFDLDASTFNVKLSYQGGLYLMGNFQFKYPQFLGGYLLFPYFGGNSVAKTDTVIYLIYD